jgi:hypothetical protein
LKAISLIDKVVPFAKKVICGKMGYLACQKFPQNNSKAENVCLSVIWLVLNNLEHNRVYIYVISIKNPPLT